VKDVDVVDRRLRGQVGVGDISVPPAQADGPPDCDIVRVLIEDLVPDGELRLQTQEQIYRDQLHYRVVKGQVAQQIRALLILEHHIPPEEDRDVSRDLPLVALHDDYHQLTPRSLRGGGF